MADTTTLNVEIDRTTRDRLEALARSTQRSPSLLAAEAIADYVDLNERQVERIEQAVAAADSGGPFVPHEEVERWAKSLGGEHEPPRPKGVRRP